jgi:flagellar basal-body rod modification protein FlgD
MQNSMLTSLLAHQTTGSQIAARGQRMTPAAASTPSGSSSSNPSSNSATITANDFLSLLVTEIQNQDPTTQTDPMQYITQLVDVNSLEQLVQINQDLTPGSGTSSSGAAQAGSPMQAAGSTTGHAASAASLLSSAGQAAGSSAGMMQPSAASALLPLGSHGAISSSAVQAVAQALGGHAAAAAPQTPTHSAMQPEVLRAIQMSIPGAHLSGLGTPADVPIPAGSPGSQATGGHP